MYDLLKPNGDLFIVTPGEQSFFQTFLDISMEESKWAKYLKEPRQFRPQYLFYEHIEEGLNKLCVKLGFNVVICKNFYKEHTFESMDELKSKFYLMDLIVG